jgi:hypothetical protein
MLPARAGRAVVRRRDLRQGQRHRALRLPRDRPARAGHRRAGLRPSRRPRRPAVPSAGAGHVEDQARRGGHRRRAGLPGVLEELTRRRGTTSSAMPNTPIESDHARLKHRLRPMRGLRVDRTAQVTIAGHAFVQNLRRGHYELAVDTPAAFARQRGLRRTRPDDLNSTAAGITLVASAQRNGPRRGNSWRRQLPGSTNVSSSGVPRTRERYRPGGRGTVARTSLKRGGSADDNPRGRGRDTANGAVTGRPVAPGPASVRRSPRGCGCAAWRTRG